MLIATRKSHQNQAVLDPWSAVHVTSGLAAGLMGFSLRTTLAIALIYELAEQAFERGDVGQRIFKTSGPERPENAVADVVLSTIGWYLGYRWNQTG